MYLIKIKNSISCHITYILSGELPAPRQPAQSSGLAYFCLAHNIYSIYNIPKSILDSVYTVPKYRVIPFSSFLLFYQSVKRAYHPIFTVIAYINDTAHN